MVGDAGLLLLVASIAVREARYQADREWERVSRYPVPVQAWFPRAQVWWRAECDYHQARARWDRLRAVHAS